MGTNSSILAGESHRQRSLATVYGVARVGHDLATEEEREKRMWSPGGRVGGRGAQWCELAPEDHHLRCEHPCPGNPSQPPEWK